MTAKLHRIPLLVTAALAFGVPGPVAAVDGVIEINQARALHGSVTPTDTPGLPVTIDSPGSYRLTGSLLADGTSSGIEIKGTINDDVTLDLNGFSITGPMATCPPEPLRGIFVEYGPATIHIRNGSIRGFCDGIYVSARAAIESVHVTGAHLDGIVAGSYSVVSDSYVEGSGVDGINIGGGSIVRGCTTNGNQGRGIVASVSSLVSGNNVNGNTQEGIRAGDGSTVAGNNVNDNQYGVMASNGVTLLDNTIRSSTLYAILFFGANNGYARNVLTNNHGGDANTQVTGTGTEIGTNICGNDTVCP